MPCKNSFVTRSHKRGLKSLGELQAKQVRDKYDVLNFECPTSTDQNALSLFIFKTLIFLRYKAWLKYMYHIQVHFVYQCLQKNAIDLRPFAWERVTFAQNPRKCQNKAVTMFCHEWALVQNIKDNGRLINTPSSDQAKKDAEKDTNVQVSKENTEAFNRMFVDSVDPFLWPPRWPCG